MCLGSPIGHICLLKGCWVKELLEGEGLAASHYAIYHMCILAADLLRAGAVAAALVLLLLTGHLQQQVPTKLDQPASCPHQAILVVLLVGHLQALWELHRELQLLTKHYREHNRCSFVLYSRPTAYGCCCVFCTCRCSGSPIGYCRSSPGISSSGRPPN